MIFLHRCLRPRHSLFGGRFIDPFGFERDIRQDRNAISRDLDEPFADRQRTCPPVPNHSQLARFQHRQQRHVIGKDAKFAFRARERHHVHVLRVGGVLQE